jgi:hypothetical protein
VYGDGEIYPKSVRFFVRKKYTTFSTERIIALRYVNLIFPESYDFAATVCTASQSPFYQNINGSQQTRIQSSAHVNLRVYTTWIK